MIDSGRSGPVRHGRTLGPKIGSVGRKCEMGGSVCHFGLEGQVAKDSDWHVVVSASLVICVLASIHFVWAV